MDHLEKEDGRSNSSNTSSSGDVSTSDAEQRESVIEWLKCVLPSIRLPIYVSDEDLRAFLIDGTVLCHVLNRLRPGSVTECDCSDHPPESCIENAKRFLAAMDQMGLPRFQIFDLEKGSMKIVLECLLNLKAQIMENDGECSLPNGSPAIISTRWKLSEGLRSRNYSPHPDSPQTPAVDRWKGLSDSKLQRALRSPMTAEQSAALFHHVGHKFHEVFQTKHECYADLPPAKISEMMKSNSLDNAPTQSLLSVVNGILDECIERKNGEIPHRVACLLRKVIQEIERRISTQAEHLRTQNNLFKAREEKYQSRIRVLEALASGTSEETQIVVSQLQQIKTEKTKIEVKKKFEEQDAKKLMIQKNKNKQEIEVLKQELDIARNTYEQRCLEMETKAKGAQQELEERLKEVCNLLTKSRSKVKELEAFSESKTQHWNKKAQTYQKFTASQLLSLRELRFASELVRQEMIETQKSYLEEFNCLETKVKALEQTVEHYHVVLAENRKLHNEVIELKGNIRVYCRIRPFLPGQMGKQTIVEYVGNNGELVVVNPSKQGKEGRRSFKFNKVYGPAATQADVFADTQPLIQSVLDGYNVCIFAYGQTGSGKTYTMTGPDNASKEDWGVNYRALNDLFHISQTRESTFNYEIGVQMVEIYNEQVRDLLSSSSQKRLGILTSSQQSGLAVPDASMYPVKLTSDVMDLMEIGLNNRAKGATSMNQRSSRSHSVLTIHARGTDLKTGASLKGSLHLVDLAGSERVDRSEVVGDRLKEAQHINKSLSALGDVIFALAQKSSHVPYRNSKLTQVLQSSLGGQAKTLMFVQLNPDVTSFSESLSTLKFAERVSGIELGAAKSSKDGKDVRELTEQVLSLKEALAKKDEEIERLQTVKDLKRVVKDIRSVHHSSNGERRTLKHVSPSPARKPIGGGKSSKGSSKGSSHSDQDSSDNSEKHSASSSVQSNEDTKSNKASQNLGQNFTPDIEILGFGDGDFEERLSDVSDGALSMGADTDGSADHTEVAKPPETVERPKATARVPRPPLKSTRDTITATVKKTTTGMKKSTSTSSLSAKSGTRRWA
ncbi:hypothetical protein LguiA_027918 [Lonicera macranthoides]